ncbi:CCR4-NOT transcription complex subunit 1, partial [Haematococcus lacustris]
SVQINATLAGLAERLGLKSLVPAAVERGVTEILSPVVERSVTIACYTTMELLMKDFALEPDEGRMRKAAHLMVSSLAGSLALVTCKDPLRVALTATLRALLTNQLPSANDAGVVEQVAAVVCNDNLDLGCAIIERAATDKA